METPRRHVQLLPQSGSLTGGIDLRSHYCKVQGRWSDKRARAPNRFQKELSPKKPSYSNISVYTGLFISCQKTFHITIMSTSHWNELI